MPSPHPQSLVIAIMAVVTLVTFYPLAQWLVAYTGSHSQLMHSFIILAFAGFALMYERKEKIQLSIGNNRPATIGFALTYVFIGLSIFTEVSLFYLPALVTAIYAWCHFLFGAHYNRIITALLISFSMFLGLVIVFPTLDWPLRIAAGKIASAIFEAVGAHTELFFAQSSAVGSQLKLIVNIAGRPFEVAPECNGFGVMSASSLLAILLSVYARAGILRGISFVAVSILFAFATNAIRILIIVYLAQFVWDHYFLMHEIVGISTFWGTLILIWIYGTKLEQWAAQANESK